MASGPPATPSPPPLPDHAFVWPLNRSFPWRSSIVRVTTRPPPPQPSSPRPSSPRPAPPRPWSPRQNELLEHAYRYALDHGLADLSLRPLAAAIGTSPRVLLFLFGSKDGLVRALLTRARADELSYLDAERASAHDDLADVVAATWRWLAAAPVRPLLTLWTEAYARSLVEPSGPWSGFASQSVDDWLTVLPTAQPAAPADGPAAVGRPELAAAPTLALAVLRGCGRDPLANRRPGRLAGAVAPHLPPTSGR